MGTLDFWDTMSLAFILCSPESWFSEGTPEQIDAQLMKITKEVNAFFLRGVTVHGPQFPHLEQNGFLLNPFTSVHPPWYFPECFITTVTQKKKWGADRMPRSQTQNTRMRCLDIDTLEHNVLL